MQLGNNERKKIATDLSADPPVSAAAAAAAVVAAAAGDQCSNDSHELSTEASSQM